MTEQVEVHQVPTVEAYARMNQDARAKAARLVTVNRQIIAARLKTREFALQAEARARARTVHTARQHGREVANAEVDSIFEDEYTRERVRAFEAYPMKQKSYGDIDACAAESHEYDLRQAAAKDKTNSVPYGTLDTTNEGPGYDEH